MLLILLYVESITNSFKIVARRGGNCNGVGVVVPDEGHQACAIEPMLIGVERAMSKGSLEMEKSSLKSGDRRLDFV